MNCRIKMRELSLLHEYLCVRNLQLYKACMHNVGAHMLDKRESMEGSLLVRFPVQETDTLWI